MLAVILSQVLFLMRFGASKGTAILSFLAFIAGAVLAGYLGRDLFPSEALATLGFEFLVILAFPSLFGEEKEEKKEEKEGGEKN